MTIACLLHNTVLAAKVLTNGQGSDHDPYHDAPDRSLIYGLSEGNVEGAYGASNPGFSRRAELDRSLT